MTDSDAAARGPRDPSERGDGSPEELFLTLEAVRSAAADTGHPATQHALDAALLALESVLIRLSGPRTGTRGGAS